MRSGASAGRPGGPGRGLEPQVTSTHQAGRRDARSPPGLPPTRGRDRLCSRVSPGKAPVHPAPREAQWGAACWGGAASITWLLLRAVPGLPLFRTRPRFHLSLRFPTHRDAPRSIRGMGFLERSPPGPGRSRGLQSPPMSALQGLGAQAGGPRGPRLHSSRASPSQRRAWWALATAWQLSGTLALAPSGCFTPRLAFCSWCSCAAPEPAQLGARGHTGASWTETHSPWEWAGGHPSWPPAWPEQVGPDGRVGAHSLHRLVWGWAGTPRPMRGLLGTLPPSPWCGHGLAGLPGLPWPGPALEERAQGLQVAGSRGSPWGTQDLLKGPSLCLPPVVHSGQRLVANNTGPQEQTPSPPPPPLPEGCRPCCLQGRWVPVPGELALGLESHLAQPTTPSSGHSYPRPGEPTQRRGFPLGPAGEIRGLWSSGPRRLQPLGAGWCQATPVEVGRKATGPWKGTGDPRWGARGRA